MAKNEFRRESPKSNHRKLIYDLTTLIIPITLILIGIFLSSQKFAELVGYDPRYCDRPIYILKHSYGKYPAGYPIFNPLVILITMFTNPFDQVAQDAISVAIIPGVACSIAGIVLWLVISVIRSVGINKNQNLYGTARWGNEKDLKKNNLAPVAKRLSELLEITEKAALSKMNPDIENKEEIRKTYDEFRSLYKKLTGKDK